MKKRFLSAVFMTMCMSYEVSAQRYVLLEEFTGEECSACAVVNPDLWTLLSNNSDKIQLVTYMLPIPMAGVFSSANGPAPGQRGSFYTITSAPTVRMDGKVFDPNGPFPDAASNFLQVHIDNGYAVPTPFTMAVRHEFKDADSIVINIDVTCAEEFTPSASTYLRVALTETLHFTVAPGSNGELDFHHMVRQMYPNANGTKLQTPFTAGATQSFEIRALVPANVKKGSEVHVSAWLQDDANNKTVHQSARSPISFPTTVENLYKATEEVSMYPNPCVNNTMLTWRVANSSSAEITVTDIMGRFIHRSPKLQTAKGLNEYPISVADLPSGIYNVTIHTNNEKITRRLTVTK